MKHHQQKIKQKSSSTELIEYLIFSALIIILLLAGTSIFMVNNYLKKNISYQVELLVKNYANSFADYIDEIEHLNSNRMGILSRSRIIEAPSILPQTLMRKDLSMKSCDFIIRDADLKYTKYTAKRNKLSFVSYDSSFVKSFPIVPNDIIRSTERGFWQHHTNDSLNMLEYTEWITHKEDTIGVLQYQYQIEDLTNLIYDKKLYKSGFYFITDNFGKFLNTNKTKFETLGEYILHSPTQETKFLNEDSDETHAIYLNIKNEELFLFYTPLQLFDWKLGLICPTDELYADEMIFFGTALIIILITIIVFSALIIRIVYHAQKPLQELVEKTKEIAKGNFTITPVPTNISGELVAIYEAFNHMQEELDIYIHSLKKKAREQERVDSEIRMAQLIQNEFLTSRHIDLSHIEVAAHLQQSRKVGGDLYDYFVRDNHLYFAIGDVSGKGIPAAIYMGSTLKLFRYIASHVDSPAKICEILNYQLFDDLVTGMYVTFLTGRLNLQTGELCFCNAGHLFPFILKKNGIEAIVGEPDVPIGIMDDFSFNDRYITLNKGEIVLLYTDGITDAENHESEFFGKERLIEIIKQQELFSSKTLVSAILTEVFKHIEDSHQSDDLTLLSILYKGIDNTTN